MPQQQPGFNFQFPNVPFDNSRKNRRGNFGGFGLGGMSGSTTIRRSNDAFTARNQQGEVAVTITGRTPDGKIDVTEIQVQDGGKSTTYKSVDKLPEQYRDTAQKLLNAVQGHAAGCGSTETYRLNVVASLREAVCQDRLAERGDYIKRWCCETASRSEATPSRGTLMATRVAGWDTRRCCWRVTDSACSSTPFRPTIPRRRSRRTRWKPFSFWSRTATAITSAIRWPLLSAPGPLSLPTTKSCLWFQKQGLKKVHGQQHGGAHRFPFGTVKLTLAFHGSPARRQ